MLDSSVEFLINTAITAPKAGGKDDVLVEYIKDKKQIMSILKQMVEISERSGFGFYKRDSITCENIDTIILVCAKQYYHNYNCGYCGYNTCELCKRSGAYCALTITDCGIALGSLVKLASILGIDNRIMLSLYEILQTRQLGLCEGFLTKNTRCHFRKKSYAQATLLITWIYCML